MRTTVFDGDKLCILRSKTPYFTLSSECENEYLTRSGENVNLHKRCNIPFVVFPYFESTVSTNIRSDPVLVCLFREKGSVWCSGPNSELVLEVIPSYFTEYVSIVVNDGSEELMINNSNTIRNIFTSFRVRIQDDVNLGESIALKHIVNDVENAVLYSMKQLNLLSKCKEYAITLAKKWDDDRERQLEKDREVFAKGNEGNEGSEGNESSQEQPWQIVRNKKFAKFSSNDLIDPVKFIRPLLVDFPFHAVKSAFSIPTIPKKTTNRFYLDDDSVEEFE